jgi:ketosteroid isomerase-like protein
MVWSTSNNKETVQTYFEAYAKWDHEGVLACLTDDVEWFVPGAFEIKGKQAFDEQIEGHDNDRPPEISVDRMIEEDDVVVAEGQVRATYGDTGTVNLVFCDVFIMSGGKIRRLTSYLAQVEELPLT